MWVESHAVLAPSMQVSLINGSGVKIIDSRYTLKSCKKEFNSNWMHRGIWRTVLDYEQSCFERVVGHRVRVKI